MSVIAEQIESKRRKREIVQRVHSHLGKAEWRNLRVRCRDLGQPCTGSDSESKR